MQSELLKLKKNGQFPDDPVKTKGTKIHHVNTQTYYHLNNRYKGDNVRGTIIIVCAILAYFVNNSLIWVLDPKGSDPPRCEDQRLIKKRRHSVRVKITS